MDSIQKIDEALPNFRRKVGVGIEEDEKPHLMLRISQWVNIYRYILIGSSVAFFDFILIYFSDVLSPYYSWWHVALLHLAAILIGVYYYLDVRLELYKVTENNITAYKGVINRNIDNIELYRIKDMAIYQPLHYRIFGISVLYLKTSDRTKGILEIEGIKNVEFFTKNLRRFVERERIRVGVREFD